MAEEGSKRRLAAILAADVVGYSRLMQRDEAGVLAALKSRRAEILQPMVSKHHGRIVKLMGDGVLVDFGSAVNAGACAIELQAAMGAANADLPEDRRIVLRVGVNLGDVMVEGSDLYGDVVNIAARLEALAEPGGVLVSQTVFSHVRGKVQLGFEDLGEQSLKNMAEPVRIYRVTSTALPPSETAGNRALPSSKIAIAVLPFTNMSSDPEQEHFGDGLTEDLITDLSKISGLFVIARHSTFAYKGKRIDIRLIANELGVRYIVEGSVRRASARVRINVQLIDATDHSHLWADRFDRDLADIFLVQDEVVGKIVRALAGVLPSACALPKRRATNLEAYDLFVRGRAMAMLSLQDTRTARPLLRKAIELDPGFVEAHAWLAMSHHFGWMYLGEAKEQHRPLARSAAQQALLLDPENADAHIVHGYLRAYEGEPAEGVAEVELGLRINPNHADGWIALADLKVCGGLHAEGIDCALNAFRLNPHPPASYYWVFGWIQYAAGRYKDAVETLRNELARAPVARRTLAAALAQLGLLTEAREEARKFLAEFPHFSARRWASTQPFHNDADREHFVDGYVKAGLPE